MRSKPHAFLINPIWRGLVIFLIPAIPLAVGQAQAQSSGTLGILPVATNHVELFWQPVTGFEQVQRVNGLGRTNGWETLTNAPQAQPPLLLLQQGVTNPQAYFRLVKAAQPAVGPTNLTAPHPTAPPPPNTQVSFADATSFLYTGSNAVQFGMTPGTIAPARAGVLRGRVMSNSGLPLAGVHIFIAGQPAYGYTYSHADGSYDLAVNGGGLLLTVDYQLAGYCPAQRQASAASQGFGHLADVSLMPLDPVATAVALGSNAPAQWATSSTQTDANGSRSAQIYLPPGTSAVLAFADGSTEAVSGLTLRVTEFTVGTNGPSAMPAVLPPSSAYTYCADFTADEALAAGAQTVNFSQPLFTYVTNFLGLPVGAIVPDGYYDRSRSCWVPSDNGLIVQIVGVTNGLAEIGFDTNGVAVDAGTLATNGFTTNELMQLAIAFPVGATLTRVPVTHFCAKDFNFAGVPGNPAKSGTPADDPNHPKDGPNKYGTLRTAEQVFEETIPVVGAPLSLHYSSARVPDYRASGQFTFPLNVVKFPTPGLELTSVEVDANIAGINSTVTNLFPTNNPTIQNVTIAWNKSWAYGPQLPGADSTVAQVNLTFNYLSLVINVPTSGYTYGVNIAASRVPVASLFEQYASLSSIEAHVAFSPQLFELTSFTRTLTLPDNRFLGLGGWSLTPQHYYDPSGQILYLGDGTIRNSPPLADAVSVAEDFQNLFIRSVAPLSDGSCYVLLNAPNGLFQIFHYTPGKSLAPVTAGSGAPSFDPFGGVIGSHNPPVPANGYPATNAAMSYAGELATGPDDTLYFTCCSVDGGGPGGSATIWHIDKQGLLRPVLYDGPWQTFQPDGTYATNATIYNDCIHLSVGPDGTVYYLEWPTIQTTNAAWNGLLLGLIRRVGTDGRIYTVAGTGGPSPSTDTDVGIGQPALNAQLQKPRALCASRDGSIYFITGSDTPSYGNPFLLRVSPTGLLDSPLVGLPLSYAGIPGYTPPANNENDGNLAANVPERTEQNLFTGSGLSQGPDGSIYWTEQVGIGSENMVLLWQLTPDGHVRRAGGFYNGSREGLARNVSFGDNNNAIYDEAKVGPDGTLFAAAYRNGGAIYTWQLLRMSTRTPTFASDDISIASDDGSELYVFDANGHHLQTLNTLTGTTNWLFGYDTNNLVTSVQDANGLVTTIQRDPTSGVPQAIVSPYGQSTALGLDLNGFLASVTDPATNVTRLTNSVGGLLQSVTGPRGYTYTARYDALGRCLGATDPSGGSDKLGLQQNNVYSDSSDSAVLTYWNIGDTNAAGAPSLVSSILLGNQTTLTERISPLNITNWEAQAITGDDTVTNADGTIIQETFVGDPRFPSQTHLLSSATIQLPGGLTWHETSTYNIVTNSQISLDTGGWTNLVSVNGNYYTSIYNGSNRTSIDISPEGRRYTVQLDSLARPIEESQPGLASLMIRYDNAGRPSSLTNQSVEGAQISTFGYDALGRLGLITDPLGQTNAFAYDAANRLTQQTLTDGTVVQFQYDAEDDITTVTPPGRPAHTFGYDAVGQLVKYTPPFVTEDDSVGYTYDAERQLTSVQFPDGQQMRFSWDTAGDLTNIVLGAGPTLSVAYSTNSGLPTQMTSTTGDAMRFNYQGFLLNQMSWSGSVTGNVRQQFNSGLLVTNESINGGSSLAFAYDADDLLTNAGPMSLTRDTNGIVTATRIGLVQDQRQYDDLARMTNYSVTVGGSNFWSVALAYDLLDRITNKVESISNAVNRTWQFAYDLNGRLSQVRLNGALAATYSYDTNGNRLALNSENATYDNQDRVQTYNGDLFSWSPNGYLLTDTKGGQTTSYTWDLRGALTSVSLPGGETLAYVLDGFGRRIGKKVNGVLQRGWLYDDDDRPVAELAGSSAVTNHFIYTDDTSTPAFILRGSSVYALISDERGSVRFVVNIADGTVAEALDYDEFGRINTDSNPGFQPFGYAGGLYDPDSGLVRFGARDYSPKTGQWTDRDPILFAGAQYSLYAYVNNDPVNRLDLLGTGPFNKDVHDYWPRFNRHQQRLLKEAAIKIARNRQQASTWQQFKNNLPHLPHMDHDLQHDLKHLVEHGVTEIAAHVTGFGSVGAVNTAGQLIGGAGNVAVEAVTGGALNKAQRAAQQAGNVQGPNSKGHPFNTFDPSTW